ncbi:hypothetical protein [Sphingobacterium lumbrici]|uniref:hypothetical protein n=1 Tax=Sphingobacterium lumbrici TaxID=2559600 RepID=UPI00112A02C0|nr:hypothetical protein [Sphingobacterium lumbrici]
MKRFIFKNAMPLIALGIASASYLMMSFGINPEKADDQFWFEVNSSNQPTQVLEEGPDPECETLEEPDCAKLYNEEDTEGTGSNRTVIPGHEANYVNYVSKIMN